MNRIDCSCAAVLATILATFCLGQPQAPSSPGKAETVSELMRLLTHQYQHRDPDTAPPDFAGCGQYRQERLWASMLAKSGFAAVPELEGALESIEKRGEGSPFSFHGGWLAYSYAKIEGQAAYQRLLRAIVNPNCSAIRDDLANALALSVNLTSFVIRSDVQMGWTQCGRLQEPRDTLNHLILACEGGNVRLLESCLDPTARGEFRALLASGAWTRMRGQLSEGQVAVAYRLAVNGRWSEPAENLEEGRRYGPEIQSSGADIEVKFADVSQQDCGSFRVKFIRKGNDLTDTPNYLIGNTDVDDLLAVIVTCAARPQGQP